MAKQVQIENWAVGLVPEIGKSGRIVALFGTLPDGTFLGGSGRIVSVDPTTDTATSASGTEYILGTPDAKSNPEGHPPVAYLQAAIKKYSK